MPSLSTTTDASRRTALAVAAELRLGAGLTALILALLVRLFDRTDAAWDFLPEHADDHANHAITLPTIGRAPHAFWIESGRFPDWILPGIRNRGMRPAARPARLRPRALPARTLSARAPPGAHPVPC